MMERKAKFVIIGLIGILVISIFLSLQLYSAKQSMQKTIKDLEKDKESLNAKFEQSKEEIRRLDDAKKSLINVIDGLTQKRAELEEKYELVNKEKDALIEQLKVLKTKPAVAAEPQPTTLAPTEDAYWAGILKAKTDLELQLEKIRNELNTIQINNEQLQREKGILALDIKSLNLEKLDLKRQLEYNQKIMDSITQEIVRERNDKFKIQESLESIKSENTLLRRQLKSLVNRKINLEKKIQKFQEDNSSLQRQLSGMEAILTDKLGKISEIKQQLDTVSSAPPAEIPQQKTESVELSPIVVRPQTEISPPKDVFFLGRVIGVNKDNNFVIINLGEDSGVKIGDTFQVYREGEDRAIATIEVVQTRHSIAACDIRKQNVPIKLGDEIR